VGAHWKEATTRLASVCEVMSELIARHDPPSIHPQPPERYFDVLVSSIIGQQLSVKAADTIEARLRDGFGALSPETLARAEVPTLRAFGLSNSKASYIIGLAEAFANGQIDPVQLEKLPDTEVVAQLTAVKGIGPWTAEMFLIFGMGHPDVWSPGDLGLKKAVWSLFGEDADPTHTSERWRPYRSYAALYLWEHSDGKPGSAALQV